MVLWTITVTDVDTGLGVPNAEVYLFAGGGNLCQNPADADYTIKTDANGQALFDVPQDFYIVGIKAKGYESAYDPHNPPEGCPYGWTCTGAGGAGVDYDFPVRRIEGPSPPTNLLVPALLAAGAVAIIGLSWWKKK